MCKRIFLFLLAAQLFADPSLSLLTLDSAEAIALEWNKNLLIAKEGTKQADERKA